MSMHKCVGSQKKILLTIIMCTFLTKISQEYYILFSFFLHFFHKMHIPLIHNNVQETLRTMHGFSFVQPLLKVLTQKGINF